MRRLLPLLAVLSLAACGAEDKETDTVSDTIEYPETATVDHTDSYHGTEIADPYRWLEEDVRESERVQEWVDAQNAVTFAYLEDIPEPDQGRRSLLLLVQQRASKSGRYLRAGHARGRAQAADRSERMV